MLIRLFFISTLLLSSFTSCSGVRDVSPLDELQTAAVKEEDYFVNAGDTLRVEVWGEPRLSGEVFVRQDGRFTMSLIGDVLAEGKTLRAASEEITAKLGEFVPGASVSVSTVQSAPTRYYLSGLFVKPGEFRSDSRITLLQAVATGGGFAPFADPSRLLLIRRSPAGEKRYQLNYDAVIDGKQPNPLLKDGDVIAIK